MGEQSNHSFETLFNTFFNPGEVTEIRAIGITGKGPWKGWSKGTVSGYFNDPAKFAKAAESMDAVKRAEGIYFTLNPVNPALLARANNRLVAPKATTSDEQVVCDRCFLIDIDSVRPSGISATSGEVEAAIDCRNKVGAWLEEKGWPLPTKGFSSNGGHALYRLEDLPNTPEITDLKRQALQAINEKFGKNGVDVDQKVFNAARIVKLYGTWGRKGDSTEDRPHRQSFLEEIPEPLEPVTLDQLKWLAAQAPKTDSRKPRSKPRNDHGGHLGSLDLERYFQHYGVNYKIKERQGLTIHILMDGCLFDPGHTKGEASIIQNGNGLITYQCFHNSCKDRTWHEAREKISGKDSLAPFCEGYDLDKHKVIHKSKVDEAAEERAAIQVESQEVEEQAKHNLEFPSRVMSGVAGDFASLYASYLESPAVFFYFSFLTCLGSVLSDRLTLASEIHPQPRYFCFLLGESADDRKSTAASKTIRFFQERLMDAINVCYGIGSAEGLQARMMENSERLLLFFDKFKAFAAKCKIEASVLLPCVNTLFESNRYESRTKHTDIRLTNAYLSILAASTVQTYENIWTSQFLDIGFPNRCFLVPGTGQRRNPIPLSIPETEKAIIASRLRELLVLTKDGLEMNVTPGAMNIYTDWYMSLERNIHAKRLDVYAMRFLPLLAINDGKTEVDQETTQKVVEIANWQLEVRKQLDPIDAENELAKMEEKIRRQLRKGPQNDYTLKRFTNAYRSGLWVYETALKNLSTGRSPEVFMDRKSKIWRLVVKNVVT